MSTSFDANPEAGGKQCLPHPEKKMDWTEKGVWPLAFAVAIFASTALLTVGFGLLEGEVPLDRLASCLLRTTVFDVFFFGFAAMAIGWVEKLESFALSDPVAEGRCVVFRRILQFSGVASVTAAWLLSCMAAEASLRHGSWNPLVMLCALLDGVLLVFATTVYAVRFSDP